MVRKILLSAAFVASIVSPALAQSYDPSVGSGNIVPNPRTQAFRPLGPHYYRGGDSYGYDYAYEQPGPYSDYNGPRWYHERRW